MRKEYQDRWTAPLVNPAVTYGEYEARKKAEVPKFSEAMLTGLQDHFAEVKARSEGYDALQD